MTRRGQNEAGYSGNSSLSAKTLLNAEVLSRQVRNLKLKVSLKFEIFVSKYFATVQRSEGQYLFSNYKSYTFRKKLGNIKDELQGFEYHKSVKKNFLNGKNRNFMKLEE